MRIIKDDAGSGKVRLRTETPDDLWHLYHLIREGDHAFSLTQRREEQPLDRIREKRAEKRTLYLGISVEKVEFHGFSDRLRIHGTILPDQPDSGSYHTLNIPVGAELTIRKIRWDALDRKRVRQAVEEGKRPTIVMVCLDDDEALVAVLRQYGVREVATIRSGRSGKRHPAPGAVVAATKNEYFREILDTVALQGSDLPLVVCGPGFAKEELLSFGRTTFPQICRDAALVSTGSDGMAGVNEVLKTGDLSKVTSGARIAYETGLVEEVLREVATSGKAAYGRDELSRAVDLGAVETMLVTDTVLKKDRDNAQPLITRAEEGGARVAVISSGHDGGKQLDSLGGMAALLRYRIP